MIQGRRAGPPGHITTAVPGNRLSRAIDHHRFTEGQPLGGQRAEIGINLDPDGDGAAQGAPKLGVHIIGNQSPRGVALYDEHDGATLPVAGHLGKGLHLAAAPVGRRIGETGQAVLDLADRFDLDDTGTDPLAKPKIEAMLADHHLALHPGVAGKLRQRPGGQGRDHQPVGQVRIERNKLAILVDTNHLIAGLAANLLAGRQQQARTSNQQVEQAAAVGQMGAHHPAPQAGFHNQLIGPGDKLRLHERSAGGKRHTDGHS